LENATLDAAASALPLGEINRCRTLEAEPTEFAQKNRADGSARLLFEFLILDRGQLL
jgi:hypothetical protein